MWMCRSAALAKMPLGIYNELRATVPLLANQSEDCLYLNIYVPGSGELLHLQTVCNVLSTVY